MSRDLRSTATYREVAAWFDAAYRPGRGAVAGAGQAHPTPDGELIAFTATSWPVLTGLGRTVVCVADAVTGAVREVSYGPCDQQPRWSPDGRRLAYLSDRESPGRHQLYVAERDDLGAATRAVRLPGGVEYYAWAPSGRRLLLGAVDHDTGDADASWLPSVRGSDPTRGSRRCLVLDDVAAEPRQVSPPDLTVWEATWVGDDRVAGLVSPGPAVDGWYRAELVLYETSVTAPGRMLYRSEVQLGGPAASPSGARLAVIEALCSDRGYVAGDLLLVDPAGGGATRLDTGRVDVTCTTWRGEDVVFYVGQRGLDVVAGEIDVRDGEPRELWVSDESCGDRGLDAFPTADGRVCTVVDSYRRNGDLVEISEGKERVVASFRHAGSDFVADRAGSMAPVTWAARDGREIEGLLVLPDGPGPHPLIVHLHGGPISAWRNRWSMVTPHVPLLVSRGYAVLHPNPRGSRGRGQEFAGLVKGDMGGEDAYDVIRGVDALVERGVADPQRVGVMGRSYGGYLTCWLVTQDQRFAAAAASSPVTDRVSQYFTCNIPTVTSGFLDHPHLGAGLVVERSPLTHARTVTTPVLLSAGMLDECTPPSQALEFHSALAEVGTPSELVVYPEEGHGVHGFPAVVDHTARIVDWFERYMPAARS